MQEFPVFILCRSLSYVYLKCYANLLLGKQSISLKNLMSVFIFRFLI